MPAPLWLARLSSAVLFGASVLFAGAAAAETIEVTDLAGRVVNVTRDPQKIVLSEGRQLYTLAMLDREDPFKRVVGWGNDLIENDPGAWAKYLAKFPKAKDIANMGNPYAADVSMEKIASLGTEVYILDLSNYFKAQETGLLAKLEKAGITTVFVDFRQDPTQNVLPSVQLLGRILGREKEANAFADYYLRQTRSIYARVGSIPDKQKPMVFVERAAGLLPCCATFGPFNFGRYIEEAGGRNWGSQFFSAFQAQAAQEKVLADNPDVYFLTGANWYGSNPGSSAVALGYDATPEQVQKQLVALMNRPGFQQLKAVQGKKVMAFYHQFYDMPYYFIAELAMAKEFYPDRFKDVDPEAVFKEFHEKFLPISYSGVFWARLQ
ncbi:ABC transporter substrate-binding protein [Bosea sp. Root670]|uniref:ABC transporter substrate-binding protein n=1 Tax=unclassified Bosea (in: a-proteobacteria) TaxID=2653178 RepID=UPI0007137907|nr:MULTISPECIES: ABC transporter substrate-binding protein [unclassified Bosea (in: a-proteobacteria)]KRE00982.1 ABC transporter substrate-binding protein [Bosea sp. Root670]TQI74876.1 iron complex transport system substrate-binding protein [Bosea sp. AK1]